MTAEPRLTERLPLLDAWAWLDACPDGTGAEAASLAECFGRVLAASLVFPEDRPNRDVTLTDGYAVRAEDTFGATTYNPLFLDLVPRGVPVVAGSAAVCHAGETLPVGADAVLPREAGEAVNAVLEVCDAVARWSGVGRRGDAARSGDAALLAGRRLHAPQIALAASLGVTHLNVRCRPDVALGIAGAKPPAIDALGAAIAALVARDGGAARLVDGDVARALPADVVVMAGRSGWGGDDHAVQSIEATGGRIDHHGLAVIPGGSSGLGWLGAAPLVLLPGDPLSALVAYELLAGRLIRRLAGRATTWPYPTQRFALSRKIASAIGMAEWVPVTCDGSIAEPLAWPPADGLAGFANADGFHLVSAGLEGYAAGALIDVVLMSGNTGITKEC